ncbi:hypothetical protein SCLCIDRAFT_1216829 [Scleroderma citrinum Foug A]|uniref:Uncharacterized protein n=1 Tax=Scleroderma citrinum Foug A TaxID=1036808 RepID=A0A0C3DXC0_9AGAM|nr:hypothetical protein SCLCIDRAFT_1216829 [Scleroderma citrinum Foug A]
MSNGSSGAISSASKMVVLSPNREWSYNDLHPLVYVDRPSLHPSEKMLMIMPFGAQLLAVVCQSCSAINRTCCPCALPITISCLHWHIKPLINQREPT